MYVTRQTSAQTGFQYALRFGRTAGNTSTADIAIIQDFESVNSYLYAGKQITLSYYARKGADWSDANTPNMQVRTGTGTDQTIVSGYTGSSTIISGAPTLTTSFQRFSHTGTVGSSATQLGLYFGYTPSGTAGADDWMEVTGVQIDIGPVALPYRRSGGTLQGEIDLCTRYYQKSYPMNVTPGTSGIEGARYVGNGVQGVTTADQLIGTISYPRMRGTPTIVVYDDAGNVNKCTRVATGVSTFNNSNVTIDSQCDNNFRIYSSSGNAAGVFYVNYTLSAEL
jgi:hypothetical protein